MRIAIISGSRADRGLLEPIYHALESDSFFHTRWIDARSMDIILESDSPGAICQSYALAVQGFSKVFAHNLPEMIMVLGDRWEISAAATAAHIMRIPIAHIHGGEETQGSYDNAFRHQITHMADIHFVATDSAERRVRDLMYLGHLIKIYKIHNVGAIGCDPKHWPVVRRKLSKNVLVAYYPETDKDKKKNIRDTIEVIDALFEFKKNHGVSYIVIGGNADKYSGVTAKMFDDLKATRIDNMDRDKFIRTICSCLALVGNSSAGIIEAPALRVPSVNIGERQTRRQAAESVFNVPADSNAIYEALENATSSDFQKFMKSDYELHYTGDNVVEKIVDILKKEMWK